MLTSTLCQPLPLAGTPSWCEIPGAVPSSLTSTVLGLSTLPAASTLQNSTPSPLTATWVPDCVAPPSTRYWVALTPERASEGASSRVALLALQPVGAVA